LKIKGLYGKIIITYIKGDSAMNLLGKMQDKEFWESLPTKPFYEKKLEALKKAYSDFSEKDKLKAFKYSEFKMFFTTGNRSVYQSKFQARRDYMRCAAMLALIYPNEQEYLDILMDIIYAICDEYTWCQPAHQGKLEPNNNTRIDLSASILASTLGEILLMLGDRLEPLIVNRIRAEVDRRVILPFSSVEDYGWWEKGRMNWTAVCAGNVAIATMILRPDIANDAFIERIQKSLDNYLTGFSPEGICYEGHGYWHYGFVNFVKCADVLRRYTDGRVDYFKLDKVRKISTFYQKVFISDNVGVSFSDCGAALNITYPTLLMHFLKTEYPDDVLVYDPKYGSSDHTEFRGFTWVDENIYISPAPIDTPLELYSEAASWLIKKTPLYGFAAKGGDNNEFHNHNDVGTFIYAKDGKQVLSDIGGGVYTRQYFNKATRYDLLECSSLGHSVPIVDGKAQEFGKEFAASGFKYENGTLYMDIAGAYGNPELTSLKRCFTLGEDSVTLTDSFEYSGDGELVCRLVSVNEAVLVEDGRVTVADSAVTYDPDKADCVISVETSSREFAVNKIDFKLKKGVREFSCVIK